MLAEFFLQEICDLGLGLLANLLVVGAKCEDFFAPSIAENFEYAKTTE